jgi:hypothetical protein
MKYTGTVKDGVVVFETPVELKDGTAVSVEPSAAPASTLGKRLKKFQGIMKGFPADFAQNHDFYLHGQPKK